MGAGVYVRITDRAPRDVDTWCRAMTAYWFRCKDYPANVAELADALASVGEHSKWVDPELVNYVGDLIQEYYTRGLWVELDYYYSKELHDNA